VELLRDILRIFRPAAPDKIDAVVKELKLNKKKNRAKLQSKTHGYLLQFLDKRGIRSEILEKIKESIRRIQDRVICPPVLLEP
jgi:hypothetical protein